MRTLILLAILAFPLSIFAQTTDTKPAEPAAPSTMAPAPAAPAAPADVVAPVAAPEAAPVPDVVKVEGDKVTVNDIVTDAKEVAEAVKSYKDLQKAGDKTAMRLALMALLAAIFKVLLSVLKFTSEFWKGKKGKLVLRVSTLALGAVVMLLSHFAAGEDWVSAIMLGVSGPLAISFHELFDIIVALVQKKPVPEPGK